MGDAGDDILWGREQSDTLVGGAGNDWLDAADGNDVYRFSAGDGDDRIYEVSGGGVDRIEFDASIAAVDIQSMRNVDKDLVLTLGTGGSIRVSNMFMGTGDGVSTSGAVSAVYGIESIVFADGVTWDAAAIKAEALRQALVATDGADTSYLADTNDTMDGGEGDDTLYGLGGADVLMGSGGADTLWGGAGHDQLRGGIGDDTLWGEEGHDTLFGGEGADVLNAGDGDDVLDGGAGNDTLFGLMGNDVYRFGRGSGQDKILGLWIRDRASTVSAIQFDASIVPSDLRVRRIPGTVMLELSIADSADQLVVDEFFSEAEWNPVQQLRFADGTVWDVDRILQAVDAEPVLAESLEDSAVSSLSLAAAPSPEGVTPVPADSFGHGMLDAWTVLQRTLDFLGHRPVGLATPVPHPDHTADSPLAMMALGAGGRGAEWRTEWRREHSMQMWR